MTTTQLNTNTISKVSVPKSDPQLTCENIERIIKVHDSTKSATASRKQMTNLMRETYLTPLLKKHERGEPIMYEDLEKSYEYAFVIAETGGKPIQMLEKMGNKQQKLEQKIGDDVLEELKKLHQSQLLEYEATARKCFTMHVEKYVPPSLNNLEVSERDSEDRYVKVCRERAMAFSKGWHVNNAVIEEHLLTGICDKAKKYFKEFSQKKENFETEQDGISEVVANVADDLNEHEDDETNEEEEEDGEIDESLESGEDNNAQVDNVDEEATEGDGKDTNVLSKPQSTEQVNSNQANKTQGKKRSFNSGQGRNQKQRKIGAKKTNTSQATTNNNATKKNSSHSGRGGGRGTRRIPRRRVGKS